MITNSQFQDGSSAMNANGRQDLSGLWDFAFLPEGTSLGDHLAGLRFESLTVVPGCFDLMPEYYLRRGTGVYRRQVEAGGEMELISEGLGLRGEFYWDGKQIATVDAPFSRRVIRFDAGKPGKHELIIAVNNEFDDTASSLFRRDYDFYAHGGLFRPVTLVSATAVRADELKILPLDPAEGTVRIAVKFSGKTAGLTQAEVRFDRQAEPVILPLKNGIGEQVFQVPSPHLWSPDDPFLHTAEIQAGGEVFAVEFGLREIECRAGKLYLNGQPLKLIGCNRHDAYPEFGYAVPLDIRLRDLTRLKQAGMNCIRGCHYPQSEELLNLCDRLGILVWEESLGWGNNEAALTDPEFQARQIRETRNMAVKSVNHPSVIIWGFLNEARTDLEAARPLVKSLAETLREFDPSRPVSYGTCRLTKDVCLDLVDVISFNTYPAWYGLGQDQFCNKDEIRNNLAELEEFASKPEYKEKPLLFSEIGAEALPGIYGGQRWSEEYQADLLETVVRFVLDSDRCSGTFLWQYCDTRTFLSNCSQSAAGGFNSKGLLDRYRNPKISWRRISDLLSNKNKQKKED